jgi:hypothetical protein
MTSPSASPPDTDGLAAAVGTVERDRLSVANPTHLGDPSDGPGF